MYCSSFPTVECRLNNNKMRASDGVADGGNGDERGGKKGFFFFHVGEK